MEPKLRQTAKDYLENNFDRQAIKLEHTVSLPIKNRKFAFLPILVLQN
jgi:hypothetical protein